MNFKNELKSKLSLYLENHKEYESLVERMHQLKENKNIIEQEIITYIKDNNASNNIFMLDSFKIQHKSIIQYQQLSNKYIEKCLNEYFQNHSISLNIKDVMNYIKDKRDKKEKEELKVINI